MKPVPARQRRQAHRQRKALARALHQVRAMRYGFMKAVVKSRKPIRVSIPKMLRRHAPLLRRTLFVLGA